MASANESASDGAGSVETISVRSPADAASASALATVVFPTPPFPATIVSGRMTESSVRSFLPDDGRWVGRARRGRVDDRDLPALRTDVSHASRPLAPTGNSGRRGVMYCRIEPTS